VGHPGEGLHYVSCHDDTTALPSACRPTATQHTIHACRSSTIHRASCILHSFGILCILLLVTSRAMLSHVLHVFFVVLLMSLLSIFISLTETTNTIVNRILSHRLSPSLSPASPNISSHTASPPTSSPAVSVHPSPSPHSPCWRSLPSIWTKYIVGYH
jgi:hypothetical protein